MATRDVLSSMLTYAHVCSRMLTFAHVCSRMLTYAEGEPRCCRFVRARIPRELAAPVTNAQAAVNTGCHELNALMSLRSLRW